MKSVGKTTVSESGGREREMKIERHLLALNQPGALSFELVVDGAIC